MGDGIIAIEVDFHDIPMIFPCQTRLPGPAARVAGGTGEWPAANFAVYLGGLGVQVLEMVVLLDSLNIFQAFFGICIILYPCSNVFHYSHVKSLQEETHHLVFS